MSQDREKIKRFRQIEKKSDAGKLKKNKVEKTARNREKEKSEMSENREKEIKNV